ncbi:MAG: hypothetical protein P8Y24_05320 [Gammaproteobacteria bacterium]
MSQEILKLAWDIEQSQVKLCGITIIIIPENLAPDEVNAIVEEQDTSLVLGQPSKITISDDKPSWFLANKLESQELLEPGSVILRDGKTKKLHAIVHDLDCEPTWKPEWISQALDNIFSITNSYSINTLQLPVLGAQHGKFKLEEFLALLHDKIKTYHGPLEKIWLILHRKDCPQALSYLKEIDKQE